MVGEMNEIDELALLLSTDIVTYTKFSTSITKMQVEAEATKALATAIRRTAQQKIKRAEKERAGSKRS
jgi:hypothetical protein